MIRNSHLQKVWAFHKDTAAKIFKSATKLNFSKTAALPECTLFYGFHAIRDHHVFQALAPQKCVSFQNFKAFGQRDMRQVHTMMKCRISDCFDSLRDHNLAYTCTAIEYAGFDLSNCIGKFNLSQEFTVQIHVRSEINRILTISVAIYMTPCFKVADIDVFDCIAIIERPKAYICQALGNGDISQAFTILERLYSNACYSFGDHDLGQRGTATECAIFNLCYTNGNFNRYKACASFEGSLGNTCTLCTLLKGHLGQLGFSLEHIWKIGNRLRNTHLCNIVRHVYDLRYILVIDNTVQQSKVLIFWINRKFMKRAVCKGSTVYALDVLGNFNTVKPDAPMKRITINYCQALRESDAFQRCTTEKRTVTNVCNPFGKVDFFKAAAIIKCVRFDFLDAIGQGNFNQRIAIPKSTGANLGYALRDNHLFYTKHIPNSIRFSHNIGWQGNCFQVTEIFDQGILTVLLFKAESVFGRDIGSSRTRIFENTVAFSVKYLLCIARNVSVLVRTGHHGQIAVIIYGIQTVA